MDRQGFWRYLKWVPACIIMAVAMMVLVLFVIGGMPRVTSWYLFRLLLPLSGLWFFVVTLVYALVRRRLRSRPILTTLAVSLLALLPLVLFIVPVTYPASVETMAPAATVRLPTDVPLTAIWGGDSVETNQHASAPDQRWAYDFVAPPMLTGDADVTGYGCYGVPVVAPIAGVVSGAHDGEPDMTPGSLSLNLEAAKGNYVSLRMDSGTYLVIAHLKPGSVLVSEGERVAEGQPIGQCGNSGNTSEPHIHIHHQRQDPDEYPVLFAEGLPLYFRDHDGPPMPVGGYRVEGETVIPTGDVVQHIGE